MEFQKNSVYLIEFMLSCDQNECFKNVGILAI